MMVLYKETTSTCRLCGEDISGTYWESEDGITLKTNCPVHGVESELVENDAAFFRTAYEHKGYVPMKYLILPATYRCNLACKYCYAHSNYKHDMPKDRSIPHLIRLIKDADCTTVNLAGGEPTVRKDLPDILSAIKNETSVKRLCVVTNGQRTDDAHYLETLHTSGMDFLFLPLHIPGYETSESVMGKILKSLQNADDAAVPVWIQASIETIRDVDNALSMIEKFKRIIFHITIRSVRPYGAVSPNGMVHVSDIIKYLGVQNSYAFGNHPFNRMVKLFGRTTKISSWVNDAAMIDPYDASYTIYDDRVIPFHKGMILDDIYFKNLQCEAIA